jgi:RecJ-like exonuclease
MGQDRIRLRSCHSCHGAGKLEIKVTCPECAGAGSVTDRQVVAKLGDLLSPEVLDKVAELIAEAAEKDAGR